MARSPHGTWIWPPRPSSSGYGNFLYDGEEQLQPGGLHGEPHYLVIRNRRRRHYDRPPPPKTIKQRFGSTAYYVPTKDDYSTMARFCPEGAPGNVSWMQVQRALFGAGHTLGDLKPLTAPLWVDLVAKLDHSSTHDTPDAEVKMTERARKAFSLFQHAERQILEATNRQPTDAEVHQYLWKRGETQLSCATFTRYVRYARRVLRLQRRTSRANRALEGRSIVEHEQIE